MVKGLASSAHGRFELASVVRRAKPFVAPEDAAEVLGLSRDAAAKVLARWCKQGWISRVRRGLYAPLSLASAPGDMAIEDPWILVPSVFAPGYLGGVTAAQHWELTDQLFRTVFVYTTRPVRVAAQTIYGTPFNVRHIANNMLFGTTAIWRTTTRLQISDVHRTLVDMLNHPADGAGIRNVSDCLRTYFSRNDANSATLIDYSHRIGNGAIFKRLGFLTEYLGGPQELVDACREHITQGNAKLDPGVRSIRLSRRWRLWLPESWRNARHD